MDTDDDQSRWGHESKWMVNSLSRLYRGPISFSIRIVILINKNLPMYSWLETIQSEVVYCIIIHLSSVLCLCFVFVQRKLKRMLDFVVLCVVYFYFILCRLFDILSDCCLFEQNWIFFISSGQVFNIFSENYMGENVGVNNDCGFKI